MKPLAVTWRPPGRTAIGQANLENLVKLGVDHIDYSISPKVEARFMVKAFERSVSTAIPMHLALFNIPLSIAVRLGIPLVVWGENSAGGIRRRRKARTRVQARRGLARDLRCHARHDRKRLDRRRARREGPRAYFGPDADELESLGVRAVFLGHYFRWDPRPRTRWRRSTASARTPAARAPASTTMPDIDDDFISLHHWMKWYKFGFTRLFDNLSLEIRNGRVTRAQAVEIVAAKGDQTPHADIDKFCAFAGISRERFFEIAERFRDKQVWQQSGGAWRIPGFLIPNWNWQS
jgi:hypothetical protein